MHIGTHTKTIIENKNVYLNYYTPTTYRYFRYEIFIKKKLKLNYSYCYTNIYQSVVLLLFMHCNNKKK